jgi:hypothetical protein
LHGVTEKEEIRFKKFATWAGFEPECIDGQWTKGYTIPDDYYGTCVNGELYQPGDSEVARLEHDLTCNLTVLKPMNAEPAIGPICKLDADHLIGPGACCHSYHQEGLEDYWKVPIINYCNYGDKFRGLKMMKCFSCSGKTT